MHQLLFTVSTETHGTRARYTIIFTDTKYIKQITENGLKVGDTKIAPRKPKPTRGYIPNLPIYALDEEVRELLSNHGNVVGIYPQKRDDGIRIGGWNFYIHPNAHGMPEYLPYENERYEVIHAGKKRTI